MGDEVWIIFKIIFPWRVINYIANFPGERGLKHYHFWGEIFLYKQCLEGTYQYVFLSTYLDRWEKKIGNSSMT